MRRYVVALAVLLAVFLWIAGSLARADYIVIYYNLGVTADTGDNSGGGMRGGTGMSGGGPPGMPGAGMSGGSGMSGGPGSGSPSGPGMGLRGGSGSGPGAGMSGGPGSGSPSGPGMGMMGGPPSGPGGPGMGMSGGGGFGPPAGFSGGPGMGMSGGPGMGMSGGPGMGMSGGPGMGMSGMGGMGPPGAPGGGGPPGGASGNGPGMGMSGGGPGMGMRGGMGMSGMSGMGGMGPPGGMSGMSGMGGYGMGGFMGGGAQVNLTPLLAIACIEVKKAENVPILGGGKALKVWHKFSTVNGSYVLPETSDKHITALLLKGKTVHQRWTLEHQAAYKGGKPTADKLLQLADWALRHGLLDEFAKTMDDLAKVDPKLDAVVAYQQVQKDMAKPIDKADVPESLRKMLDSYKVERSEHYALLHNLETTTRPPEVDSRLKRLEANYRSFFYWFALQGKVLKVPEERLVGVLIKQPAEFKRQQQIFDSMPTVADGFLARRENLAVFSMQRTDAASEALEANTRLTWQTLTTDRDKSLRTWPRNTNGQPLDISSGAEIQTIALLQRALDEDAEIASVTHEGTRQLLAATGELPRNVAVPEWLQFGWAAFFETPKGALWTTFATPSITLMQEYNYLGQYKAADKQNKLEKKRVEALEKVVTDAYFRDVLKNPKNQEAQIKAHTLAWSLTYFLANKKLDGLRRYHEELRKLPRDLEFDPQTLLLAFARAFDCVDPNSPNSVDRSKLAHLADQWHDAIDLTPAEAEDMIKDAIKAQNELKSSGGTKPGDKPNPK